MVFDTSGRSFGRRNFFGGDSGHGEPAFYDAEGKYVIFSEMNIPDEVNGSFIGSGGEGREYFNKLEISEEKMESVTFDQKPGSDEENQWTDEYYENYLKENFSDPALEWELNYRVE